MKNILDLLGRFSRSLNKDDLSKEAIVSAIEKHTRVRIAKESLHLKDGVLEITASPVLKSEINLKEGNIKEDLKAQNIAVSRFLYK